MLNEDFLFTEEELKNAKSQDLLPCKCNFCGKTFYRYKRDILTNIKLKRKHIFCSHKCSSSNITTYFLKCEQCGKEIIRTESWSKKSKHHFCSHSCAVKYQNTNKTTGFRRSKLEIYLENRLTELYPNLEIIYNDRNTLGNGLEIDIYIPSLKLAFELNGPFHYIPAFGQEKLDNIKNNDSLKLQKCQELDINVCVIDVSKEKGFTEKRGNKYLNIIKQFLI
jgi:hypothetical protein